MDEKIDFFIPPACLDETGKVFSEIKIFLVSNGYRLRTEKRNLVVAENIYSGEKIGVIFSDHKVSFFLEKNHKGLDLKKLYQKIFSLCGSKREVVFIFPLSKGRPKPKTFFSKNKEVYNWALFAVPLLALLILMAEIFQASIWHLFLYTVLLVFVFISLVSLVLPIALKATRTDDKQLLVIKVQVDGQELSREKYLSTKKALYQVISQKIDEETIWTALRKNGVNPTKLSIYVFDFKELFQTNKKKPRVYLVNTMKRVSYSISFPRPLVLISTGLLAELTPEELKGVLMHEYSHIKNRDTVVLPLIVLSGIPIAYWILSSSLSLPFFVVFLLAYYVSLSLLFKAIELRADVYAARKVGGDVYSKTIVKLEYPRLIRHKTAVTKILNLLNIASYPLPTQRLHAVEHSRFVKGNILEMMRFLLS